MKKFLLLICIIFLLSLLSSCVITRSFNLYQKQYSKEFVAIEDVYKRIHSYGLDSIPLEKWITLNAPNYNGYIIQKTARYPQNEKTNFRFVYSTIANSDSTFYLLKIICDTKDRKVQKKYIK